ncbi:hypothetical protein ACWER6_03170 [Streptomyces sp. NPDC004009]
MGRDLGLTAGVVQGPLLAPVDTADGEPVRLVEVRHRLVVLDLPVLDHQLVTGPIRVDRQPDPPAPASGVAEQPVEPVLRQGRFAENPIAQVDDVRLVTVASRPHGAHPATGPACADLPSAASS